MFNKLHEVKYHEMTPNGILKPSALMQYLEDIAAKNADTLDFGYDAITSNNFGWFLLKYTMEFQDYPQNKYELIVETEPRGANKLFAYRDFYIKDKNGNQLGKVCSTWGLIDLATKSMLSPAEVFAGKMLSFEKKETDLKYNKIPAISEVSNEKTFEVRFDDIDVNRHVNNATYIVWAFEALPVEFMENKKLQRLDINFKKEMKYGASVVSQVSISDNQSVHSIKNASTGEELATLLAIWN